MSKQINRSEIWNSFWTQLGNSKNIKVIDSSTFFHYVVLEYFGKLPHDKTSEIEKSIIREIKKGTSEYDYLFSIFDNRMKDYTVS